MAEQEPAGARDQFGRVDDAPDPGVFVRFLEVAAAMDTVQVQRERTYALLAVRAGGHELLSVSSFAESDASHARPSARLPGRTAAPGRPRSPSPSR